MVKKGTAQLITTLVIVGIIAIFLFRFGGLKIITDFLSGITKAFGSGGGGDSGGGGETTVIITGSTDAEGTESGVSPAGAAEEIVTTGSAAFITESPDFSNEIVANISGLGPVTLSEAEKFLSSQGFSSLELALEGQLDPNQQKSELDIAKLEQELISKAVGVQLFGEDFASPLGAFANPDFFTEEEKIEAGFIEPITEPTQQEIQEQKITELEKQVAFALEQFEITGVFDIRSFS